jgi:alkanesulfonate monooxygenase SsuD/methylene tetrahydromethanopterin reductase-like flavin-dependent oxidoreductase (luciferase family)
VDSATGGRLEIGLGAGHSEQEFAAAGLPFLKPAARLKLLTEHITEIRARLSDPTYIPPSVQKPPPILVAGVGDKLLTIGVGCGLPITMPAARVGSSITRRSNTFGVKRV